MVNDSLFTVKSRLGLIRFLSSDQWAGIAGAASGGLLSGVFGMFEGKSNRKFQEQQNQLDREFNERMQLQQQAYNSREARYNRDWNSNEAEIARNFQTEMWNRQNAYNDPSALRQRLIKAGMNPDIAYNGAGDWTSNMLPTSAQASGGASASSGMASSHSNSSPVHYGLQDAVNSVSDNLLKNAEAFKASEEGIDRKTFRQFEVELKKGEIKYQTVKIVAEGEGIEYTKAQKKQLFKSCESMDQQIQESKARTQTTIKQGLLLDEQKFLTQSQKSYQDLQNARYNDVIDAQVERDMAAAGFSKAETYEVYQLVGCKMNLMQAQAYESQQSGNLKGQQKLTEEWNTHIKQYEKVEAKLRAQGVDLDNQLKVITNQSAQFQLEVDKDFARTERAIGCVTSVGNMVANVAGSFMPGAKISVGSSNNSQPVQQAHQPASYPQYY